MTRLTAVLDVARAPSLRRLCRYLGVGASSALLDVGLLVVLREGTRLPLWMCSGLAFACAVAVNFTLNRQIWSTTSGGLSRHASRYAALVVINLVVTVVVVSAGSAVGVPYVAAKAGVIAATSVWNFYLYRSWVFA